MPEIPDDELPELPELPDIDAAPTVPTDVPPATEDWTDDEGDDE